MVKLQTVFRLRRPLVARMTGIKSLAAGEQSDPPAKLVLPKSPLHSETLPPLPAGTPCLACPSRVWWTECKGQPGPWRCVRCDPPADYPTSQDPSYRLQMT